MRSAARLPRDEDFAYKIDMSRAFLVTFIISFAVRLHAAESFCVQHFNAYGPVYSSQVKSRTTKLTSELLSEAHPCDVVQLIEVWKKNQAAQITLALSQQYEVSAPNLKSRNGLMSLVRGEIVESDTINFPINRAPGAIEKIRNMVKVKKAFHVIKALLPGQTEPIYFVNTHLHPTSQAIRIAQVVDLFQWRMQHQNLKMILSGDFNANKKSLERSLIISLLAAQDSLEEAVGGYSEGTCTYCEENPRSWLKGNQVLDYIFYSNVSAFPSNLVVKSGSINLKGRGKQTLSDHYGVRVYFSIEQPLGPRKTDEVSDELFLQKLLDSVGILTTVDEVVFKHYIEIITQVHSQVQQRRGHYWDYHTQLR